MRASRSINLSPSRLTDTKDRSSSSSRYSLHFILYPIFSLDLPVTQTEADLDKIVPFLLQHLSHVQLLALATQLFWCARLTFNGWRRGFFNPRTEDYRWIVLRENWPKGIFGWIAWRIFNAGFIGSS